MSIVINGHLYRDGAGLEPLPGLIGPFPDRDAAIRWLDEQAPLWGSPHLEPLGDPEVVSRKPSGSQATHE